MVTENGRAELRGLYTDPAQLSMPAAVGHAALAALRARRVRLGPVVADSRRSVMRVGFLVAPAHESERVVPPPRAEVGVPPGVAAGRWTPAGALLAVLAERSGARAL